MIVEFSWRTAAGDRPDQHGAVLGCDAALVFYGDDARGVFELMPDLEATLRAAHAQLRLRGTTGVCAAAIAVGGDRVRFAWVGDCRVYRVRGGRAERLSRDQTLAEQLAAEGFAATGPLAEEPLNRLGLRDPLVVATLDEPLLAGDRLALATVGVWRDRTEVAVLDLLREPDRDVATAALVNGPSRLESTALIVDVQRPPG